ncbi:MAG: hypothetical protein J0L85_18265 [Zoogloea sp.]|nr:hypothetical protein [Zoogloea sp.]MCA0184560.1 hypothetical protein [Pseudomonadota bacterium]
MHIPDYLETLDRFELGWMRKGGDLQIKNGDIALTLDGDLQLGDSHFNSLFRLIERWRHNQPTLDVLYASMLGASDSLDDMQEARDRGNGALLSQNPAAYHHETAEIMGYESASSVYAGSIVVVLNNMLQRLRKDLGASEDDWKSAGPMFSNYSAGSVITAAANNFRHHDEWARANSAAGQQLASMEVLCAVIRQPVQDRHGHPSIRTNVCKEVLLAISDGSVDRLHNVIFEFSRALAK